MSVIHVMDLRKSPGNQPRTELGDIPLLVCFIVEAPLRAYRLTLIAWPVPNPSGKQTVLPLLQCVGATQLCWVSSRFVTEYFARVVVRLPSRGCSPSPAPPRAAPAAHHAFRAPRVI